MLEIRSNSHRNRVTFVFGLVAVLPVGTAQAHWGHLGELAGHAHVAGIALGGLAVALGAGLIVKGKGKGKAETEDSQDEVAAEPEMESEPANG